MVVLSISVCSVVIRLLVVRLAGIVVFPVSGDDPAEPEDESTASSGKFEGGIATCGGGRPPGDDLVRPLTASSKDGGGGRPPFLAFSYFHRSSSTLICASASDVGGSDMRFLSCVFQRRLFLARWGEEGPPVDVLLLVLVVLLLLVVVVAVISVERALGVPPQDGEESDGVPERDRLSRLRALSSFCSLARRSASSWIKSSLNWSTNLSRSAPKGGSPCDVGDPGVDLASFCPILYFFFCGVMLCCCDLECYVSLCPIVCLFVLYVCVLLLLLLLLLSC